METLDLKFSLLGNLTISDYIAGYIFAFIGMFLRWIYKTIDGVKNNPNTPNRFILTYWINKNLKRKMIISIAVIITIFITFRFSVELMGWNFSLWYAFIIGLTIDYIIEKLKKITL